MDELDYTLIGRRIATVYRRYRIARENVYKLHNSHEKVRIKAAKEFEAAFINLWKELDQIPLDPGGNVETQLLGRDIPRPYRRKDLP